MKKLVLFLLILFFGLSFTTSHVDAAFWSNWFHKETPIITEQVQPAKQSFWSRIINVFKKEEQKPEEKLIPPKPEVNEADVQARINALKNIGEGTHLGRTDLDFTFTQEELDKVGLPYLNEEINKINSTSGKIIINKINLLNNAIEGRINIEKPLSGDVYVRLIPRADQGKIVLFLDSVKFQGLPIPKALLEKLLEKYKINLDNLVFPIPHVNLESLSISPDNINFTGIYNK